MRVVGWIVTAVLVAGASACGENDEAAVLAAPMKVERVQRAGSHKTISDK